MSIISSNLREQNKPKPKSLDLSYKLSDVESEQDYSALAGIINSKWFPISTSAYNLQNRIESKHPFMIAYLNEKGGKRPVGILETIALEGSGNPEDIKDNYYQLTDNGMWFPLSPYANTLVFVDITVNHKGVGKKLIQAAADSFARFTDLEHFFTYTPDKQDTIRWHERNGATDTGHKIDDARPGFSTPDVNMMDYTDLIMRIRRNI